MRRLPTAYEVPRMVLAHRGASAHFPANTIPAFDAAIQAGADAIETDVHWTRDGVCVACHDTRVDKVSDGKGCVADLTLAEIRKLDFGYWFSADNGKTYPFRGRGVGISTMEEILCRYPTVAFNVDLKPKQGGGVGAFLELLDKADAFHRVVVASFHDATLKEIRSRNNVVVTSASVREVALFLAESYRDGRNSRYRPPFQLLQVPPRMYGVSVVNSAFLRLAVRHRLPVHVWTVDREDEMGQLYQRGIQGIVTNRPATAVSVRDSLVQ